MTDGKQVFLVMKLFKFEGEPYTYDIAYGIRKPHNAFGTAKTKRQAMINAADALLKLAEMEPTDAKP